MLPNGASRWYTLDTISTPRGRLHHSLRNLVYTLAVTCGKGYHWGPGHGWWGFRGTRKDWRGRIVEIDEPNDARREYVHHMVYLQGSAQGCGGLKKRKDQLMKIWLDDDYNDLPCDKPPDESWVHVHNEKEFFHLLECIGEDEEIEVISFDHDLGDGELTGHDILKKLVLRCIEDTSFRLWPHRVESQSDNPWGRENILGLAASFERSYISPMRVLRTT